MIISSNYIKVNHKQNATLAPTDSFVIVLWAKDINEAIELIQTGEPAEYGQDSAKQRELTFLETTKNPKLAR